MSKKILVPTDFSDFSHEALRYACAFGKNSGATIECVHVVDMTFLGAGGPGSVYASAADVDRSTKALRTKAQKEIEHFVRKEHLLGIEVKAHLREGVAADEIVKMADEIGADLIVIPTHGRSGLDRLVFGSTCEKVLRTAKIPVLAIKAGEPDRVGKDLTLQLKRILCPIDFSTFSEASIPVARSLAKMFNATVILAHIVDTRFDYPEWSAEVAMNNSQHLLNAAKEHVERLAKGITEVKVEVHVSCGVPSRTLVDLTADGKADLVIMPTHGRKGLAHVLLGSVTERVARGAHCPVLTVRPSA